MSNNTRTALREFGTKIGLPQIDFNDDNFCTLAFDDIIVNLELVGEGEYLAFYLWIAAVEAEQRAEVAQAAADANYLFSGTHGATLGMSRSTGDLVLAAQIADATLTLARLEQTLENLVNLAQSWRTRLTEGTLTDTASNSSPLSFGADFGLRV
ncbi:MAG: hypothetical protein QG599_289 [Pseudomonadota bacterium]|nr:hypothetical protein [Pseudomonadota bacterium]